MTTATAVPRAKANSNDIAWFDYKMWPSVQSHCCLGPFCSVFRGDNADHRAH